MTSEPLKYENGDLKVSDMSKEEYSKMEELYKNELQILKDFAQKEQYVPLSKILQVFQNPTEELLDDVIKYLTNKRNKQLEKQAKKEATEFVVVKPKVEEVKNNKKSNKNNFCNIYSNDNWFIDFCSK